MASVIQTVTTTIKNALAGEFKDIDWVAHYKGATRGKQVIGSVSCDRQQFAYDAKNNHYAKATYSILLIDPNCTDTVDETADEVAMFLENRDMGIFLTSVVTEIVYGQPQGLSNAGAAILTYEVSYELED